MKIIIIPDIHNFIWDIEKFLASQKYDLVVFLGDYFDNFNETLEGTAHTARWLKKSLAHKNRKHLLGNHDAAYRFFTNRGLYCDGFSLEKSYIINKILSAEDWAKTNLIHFEGNFIFSHAGVTQKTFEHPVLGINKDYIEKKCEEAIKIAEAGLVNEVWDWGKVQGGWKGTGRGITWVRWWDLKVLNGWNQIVGHTPSRPASVRVNYLPNKKEAKNFNVCLDAPMVFGVLENGVFSWGSRKDGKIREIVN